MDIDAFTAVAEREFAALPEEVKALAGDIVLAIADDPPPDALAELGLQSPDDLLGLFEGLGMSEGDAVPVTGRFPNRISLYRRPILNFQREGEDTIEAVIRHVLVHEIGHHFGLSDADMEAIDDEDA